MVTQWYQIVFTDVEPGKTWKIYVMPALGGKAEELLPEDALAELDLCSRWRGSR